MVGLVDCARVELGFCETLLSSSFEFKPSKSFGEWVERSTCEIDSMVSYWLILPVDVLGQSYTGHLGQQWWAEACDLLFHGDGWVQQGRRRGGVAAPTLGTMETGTRKARE